MPRSRGKRALSSPPARSARNRARYYELAQTSLSFWDGMVERGRSGRPPVAEDFPLCMSGRTSEGSEFLLRQKREEGRGKREE